MFTLQYQKIAKKTLIVALLLISSCLSKQDEESFKITPKVVDGDSITKKIRLYGIDAPEYDQKFGKEAKKYLYEMVKGKEVTCYKRSYDKYGRIIAECFIDELNINAEMVRNGYAWAYRYYGSDYNKLEDYAKKNKLGLWSDTDPVPPWDHRKQKKQQKN